MPRISIDGHPLISYDYSASKEIYWEKLSQFIVSKYGNQIFKEHSLVEGILLDSFQFLVGEFKFILSTENNYSFYTYIFWLHEESIKIHIKTISGLKLEDIDESELARYRRILKLILEQGCEINFEWGEFPDSSQLMEMDKKIQHLLYIATWMYSFADFIAFQKMVKECHSVSFNDDGYLKVDWQHHFGFIYNKLFPLLSGDYEEATFDENAVKDLKEKINECFSIDYDYAGGIIFEIKKHHNPKDPYLQTIEPFVLPINLSKQFGISEENAKVFYHGLTLTRENKLSIENIILKPYSTRRYMFRPILVYTIDGVKRALVGAEKFSESILVLSTNALQWNAMLDEWKQNPCISKFVSDKGNKHDKILEDEIEEAVKKNNLIFSRGIKSFTQYADNVNIENALVGEIDFIILNLETKTMYVTEVKYNRARYEPVGYRNDYSNFKNIYEKKMTRKVKWIKDNIQIVAEHFSILNDIPNLDLSGFNTKGVFFINTPTFYMFNGDYKAITLKNVSDYIIGKYDYPEFTLSIDDKKTIIKHPYFKKPIV